jgi:hypothetical protein
LGKEVLFSKSKWCGKEEDRASKKCMWRWIRDGRRETEAGKVRSGGRKVSPKEWAPFGESWNIRVEYSKEHFFLAR